MLRQIISSAFLGILLALAVAAQEPRLPDGAAAVTPRLIKFAGALNDPLGRPMTGVHGVTFALYRDQEGGSPIWLETTTVEFDEQGRFTVLLGGGSERGLTPELFASGEPRWVGAHLQLPGYEEQPRTLLVSVPYAIKALDAETLGGRPASDYALSPPALNSSKAESSTDANGPEPVFATSGTVGRIAKFTTTTELGDSVMFESSGNIGVGTTTPAAKLDILGGFSVAGFRGNSTDAVMTFQNIAAGGGSWDMVATADGSVAGPDKFSIAKTGVAHYFTIKNGGNIGFSTTNPTTKLEIVDSPSGGVFLNGPNGDSANVRFRDGTQAPSDFNMDYRDGRLRLFTETGLGIDGVVRATVSNTGEFDVAGKVRAGGYAVGVGSFNAHSLEIGGTTPDATNGKATLFLHHHNSIAHQLRYTGGVLYFEAAGNGYGTNTVPQLHVGGLIKSSSGGFVFPDGTIQTTAAGSLAFGGSANAASASIDVLEKLQIQIQQLRTEVEALKARLDAATSESR